MSFDCLRYFVTHLDKNCKAKKDCKEKGIPENGKQRRSIRHKDSWCKLSNEQLNQQLAIIKGTKGEESSVAGDTRSDSNGMIKGRSKGATPESLASTNHRSGEGDEGSSESGSSIRSHPVINHKAAHPQLETSADETLQAENHRPLKKRRRTGTIVSTKPLSSAQMNQSHRVHENGDIGGATSVFNFFRVSIWSDMRIQDSKQSLQFRIYRKANMPLCWRMGHLNLLNGLKIWIQALHLR